MRKNNLLLPVLLLLLGLPAQAKDYKILYLSPNGTVLINGEKAHVATVFSDDSIISWSDDRQVMKVADVLSRKQYVVCARSIEGKKEFTLSDYFFLSKTMASRGGICDSFADLSSYFQGIVPVDSVLVLSTRIPQDDSHFFYLKCRFRDEEVNKAIPPRHGYLVLSVSSIFMVDGEPVPIEATEASLYYYDSEEETSLCVSPSFLLAPVF